eukprot:TRINITY_DN1641_c0_g1_i5.p1 TRINITY_DN1641_c0_g1~~TRINITY_DN1641_c0_g1_i5.p1  ORF type:complete len:224 (+),score=79.92 TRINITY_DN1641_c0_g1_i5:1798-2469(+)
MEQKVSQKVEETVQKELESLNDVDRSSRLKEQGNEAFKKNKFQAAITAYSEAIALTPEDAILYSNRSVAFWNLKDFQKALQDATEAVRLNPEFVRGHLRQGKAYDSLGDLVQAKLAYERALAIEPDNKVAIQDMKIIYEKIQQQKELAQATQKNIAKEAVAEAAQTATSAGAIPANKRRGHAKKTTTTTASTKDVAIKPFSFFTAGLWGLGTVAMALFNIWKR